MDIDSLKIVGFKSFADPIVVPIDNGITGIVGPNGCGKSNLIEALRWAMGETSAKRMRADGMDDVIFNGADKRLARSSAEVTISINNSARKAPLEFNTEDRLDVSRKISRGEGSAYKVNGKPARAKDIQVLFKDAGIGAGSSALVSQGKVASIINAKAIERRSILEEAAGVTGLTSRRHEAELRLKGTEQNIERADDLEKNLNDQLGSLRRQARQAKRRKDIDAMVRAAEATVLLIRWSALDNRLSNTQKNFDINEEQVKNVMLSVKIVEDALIQAEQNAGPAIKNKTDAETLLALAKARVESVKKEMNAAKSALSAGMKSVERTRADLNREKSVIGNAGEEYEELKDNLALAIDDRDYDKTLIEEANIVKIESKDELDKITLEISLLGEKLVLAKAEYTAAQKQLSDAEGRKNASTTKIEEAKRKLTIVQNDFSNLPNIGDELDVLRILIDETETVLSEVSDEYAVKLDEETQIRGKYGALSAQVSLITAELDVLKNVSSEEKTIASYISVKKGYEKSVAAAFGVGINAALNEGEVHWWQKSEKRGEHPKGSIALSDFVTNVPKELEALISVVGVVDEINEEKINLLNIGQILVTKDGDVLRWDGYRSLPISGADEEIKKNTRISELDLDFQKTNSLLDVEKNNLEQVVSSIKDIKGLIEKNKNSLKENRDKYEKVRRSQEDVLLKRKNLEDQLISINASISQLSISVTQDVADFEEAQKSFSLLPNLKKEESTLQNLRSKQSDLNVLYEKAREAFDKTRRDAEARHLMIQNIEQQMKDFDRRMVLAREHIAELQKRLEDGELDLERLAEADALGPEAEAEALEVLEEAAIKFDEALLEASTAEDTLISARIKVKEEEVKLGVQKEERVRILSELKAVQEAQEALIKEIRDRLSCDSEELLILSGLEPNIDLPNLDSAESRFQRLVKERDTIGTVNLLAEDQLLEVEERLGEANKVKEELREAVRRLRKSISEFEQESRERLTEAFSLIDGHFRDLFTRLFGGGHAYLKLSESDDILHAGLEIYACPPGKKLQTMSLMSGGEQALSALALIFAAFLIRPAPVCVLDEVDAPLDDSNVDLLCSLVADMAKDGTKFLMITHHSLTMAKCDRLYGVTMMEKGVSRVATLDINSAINLID